MNSFNRKYWLHFGPNIALTQIRLCACSVVPVMQRASYRGLSL